jgi:hypothetical protein
LIKRRLFMAGLAAAMQTCTPSALAGAGAPNLDLLVAGPDGEQTSRWGNACALALAPGFPGSPNIIPKPTGGLDGVTGANRLDALVVPDGRTAAIMPGAALIAWITGDDRVHFDPTRWAPVMAGTNAGVLVARLNRATPSVPALQAFGTLRLAAESPQSDDLAALLGLQCLSIPTAPVFGLRGADAKTRAFVAGEVDAVFLCGEGVPEDIAPLSANGGVPVFCLGQIDAAGNLGSDDVLAGVPTLTAFRAGASSPLDAAYAAAAAAARLDFFMVLPRLTDPQAIAAWRVAALAALQSPALVAAASASAIFLQSPDVTAANLSALNLSPTDQSGLQDFIAQRFGQQAG